ncbi:MAG: type II toxin-antitoxin system VapB family antitoxin [Terriglobales bacterium]
MKKTLNIDAALLQEARAACGAGTDTETVRRGLEALVQRAAFQRIREYFGSEPDALSTLPPRRREEPRARRQAAR